MSKPTATEIINQVAAAVQGAAHELTLFHHDNTGAVVFDVITQDFNVWTFQHDGILSDGAANDLPAALRILVERTQWHQRHAAQHAARQNNVLECAA